MNILKVIRQQYLAFQGVYIYTRHPKNWEGARVKEGKLFRDIKKGDKP
jgi:hypothetical protein